MERPKPFNTWVLLDPFEDTVELIQSGVLDFKTTPAVLLVLDPDLGTKPRAEILLKSTHIRVLCRNGVFLDAPSPDQRLCLPDGETAFYDLLGCANLISPG